MSSEGIKYESGESEALDQAAVLDKVLGMAGNVVGLARPLLDAREIEALRLLRSELAQTPEVEEGVSGEAVDGARAEALRAEEWRDTAEHYKILLDARGREIEQLELHGERVQVTVAVQQRLEVVPVKQAEAKAFVRMHHRHHVPSVGSVFQVAVADEAGAVRGVAMVGRPVARAWDDGWTLEVTRVATDGCANACSALYGAAWRAAKALGWRRLITYTLASESGCSLRAAGWSIVAERTGRSWADSSKARPRIDTYAEHGQGKLVWSAEAASEGSEVER